MTLDEVASEATRLGFPISAQGLLKIERGESPLYPELLERLRAIYELAEFQVNLLLEVSGRTELQFCLMREIGILEPPTNELVPLVADGGLSAAEFEVAASSWWELSHATIEFVHQARVVGVNQVLPIKPVQAKWEGGRHNGIECARMLVCETSIGMQMGEMGGRESSWSEADTFCSAIQRRSLTCIRF